jgi:hypothetical protein
MMILTFLGLALSFATDSSAMFNPGDLIDQNSTDQLLGDFRSNAEFEQECQYCHAPLETTQTDLCVRCHTNIIKQTADQTGTHAKIINLQECRTCHLDHKGRDFDPSLAALRHYDHDLTASNPPGSRLILILTPYHVMAATFARKDFDSREMLVRIVMLKMILIS